MRVFRVGDDQTDYRRKLCGDAVAVQIGIRDTTRASDDLSSDALE